MKKPAKCITPKRDRDSYNLNARDLKNLMALVTEANVILSYYINMPENRTGELESSRVLELVALQEAINDLHNTIEEVAFAI